MTGTDASVHDDAPPTGPSASGVVRRRVTTLALCLALAGAALAVAWGQRGHPWARVLSIAVRGDRGVAAVLRQYKLGVVPERAIALTAPGPVRGAVATWAFRPSHVGPTSPAPVVGDVDRDGDPEVYLGSHSQYVYALDGKTGRPLWRWALPFGVVGARAVVLADLDGDGEDEIVVGSSTTLPIRVYVLRGGAALRDHDRLKWVADLSGDFIEGGLAVVRHPSLPTPLVVAATRDAPYSRGTLNVLRPDGSFLYPPIGGVDVCLARPASGTLPRAGGGGVPALVHGSHKFYGARYGHQIVARDLRTGALLWATPMGGDTGFQQHQIVDLDFDSRPEVVAASCKAGARDSDHYVLDGATGAILQRVGWDVQCVLPAEKRLLVGRGSDQTLCLGPDGVVYTVPFASFAFDDAGGDGLSLFHLGYDRRVLTFQRYRGSDGAPAGRYSCRVDLPAYERVGDYGVFGEPHDAPEFRTLADTDNDGTLDALVQVRDFIVNVKLPVAIHGSTAAFRRLTNDDAGNVSAVWAVERPGSGSP